jgi:hypothetical protein
MTTMLRFPDFTIEDQGTVVLFRANTPVAKAWWEEHVPEAPPECRRGDWIVADHRPAQTVVDVLASEGFSIQIRHA